MNGTLTRDQVLAVADGISPGVPTYQGILDRIPTKLGGRPADKNGYMTAIELDLAASTVAVDGTCTVLVSDGSFDAELGTPDTWVPSACCYFNDTVAVTSTDEGSVIAVASLNIEQADFHGPYPKVLGIIGDGTLEVDFLRVRAVFSMEGN